MPSSSTSPHGGCPPSSLDAAAASKRPVHISCRRHLHRPVLGITRKHPPPRLRRALWAASGAANPPSTTPWVTCPRRHRTARSEYNFRKGMSDELYGLPAGPVVRWAQRVGETTAIVSSRRGKRRHPRMGPPHPSPPGALRRARHAWCGRLEEGARGRISARYGIGRGWGARAGGVPERRSRSMWFLTRSRRTQACRAQVVASRKWGKSQPRGATRRWTPQRLRP